MELAAAAGDEELDLGAASSSRMVHFQDDTEWVDTEFSFGGTTQQQQQQHTDGHLQDQQQQQQHEHDDAGLDEAMSQPFVRSLFNKAASSATAGSGGCRAGGAGRSRQQAAAAAGRSAAAAAAAQAQAPLAAALGDVVGMLGDVQLLAVPADQVGHWQQLEASMPDMQRGKEQLRKMRVDLERAATRLQEERSSWEKQKVRKVA
jgi:hypothetical protein